MKGNAPKGKTLFENFLENSITNSHTGGGIDIVD